jgi:hypothetical protein
MAVASKIEAIEFGTERSREAVEDERLVVLQVLGVLGFFSAKLVVRDVRDGRFGGMTTGLVCVGDRSSLSGRSRPGPTFCAEEFIVGSGTGDFSPCWRENLGDGTELNRKARGTIMFAAYRGHSAVV